MQLKTVYGSKVTFISFQDKTMIWVNCDLGPNHILIEDLDEESKRKVLELLENKS
jgi:hypothetical protein